MPTFFLNESRERVMQALDSWNWLSLPIFADFKVSAMGDLFLKAGDGRVWFLDSLEGKCTPEFPSIARFDRIMSTEQGQDHYLMAGMVMRAEREGLLLQPGQCYDWKLSPVVGGKIQYENLQTMDFVVSLHIAGQIHAQVRNYAPGTKISSFVMVDPNSPPPSA